MKVAGKMTCWRDYSYPALHTIGATSICFRPKDMTLHDFDTDYRLTSNDAAVKFIMPSLEQISSRAASYEPSKDVNENWSANHHTYLTLHNNHEVVQYIDDSSSMIGFTDYSQMELYLSLYVRMLNNYYAMNCSTCKNT